jgi:hypothetical protein
MMMMSLGVWGARFYSAGMQRHARRKQEENGKFNEVGFYDINTCFQFSTQFSTVFNFCKLMQFNMDVVIG